MARVLFNLDLEVLPNKAVRRIEILIDVPGSVEGGYSTVIDDGKRLTPGWATADEIARAMDKLYDMKGWKKPWQKERGDA